MRPEPSCRTRSLGSDALIGQRPAQQHLQARPQRRYLVFEVDQLMVGLVGDLAADGRLDVSSYWRRAAISRSELKLVHQTQVTALASAPSACLRNGHQNRGDHRNQSAAITAREPASDMSSLITINTLAAKANTISRPMSHWPADRCASIPSPERPLEVVMTLEFTRCGHPDRSTGAGATIRWPD